jgi:hypothetical protein
MVERNLLSLSTTREDFRQVFKLSARRTGFAEMNRNFIATPVNQRNIDRGRFQRLCRV